MLREEGITGVHTHVRQLRRYLAGSGNPVTLVTPFSWGGALVYPVFGFRRLLERCSRSAGVAWYRHWHEVFLRNALRRCLAEVGDCVVYAQDPLAARAALRARRGPHQRVVLAVHFRISQADEWVDKEQIKRDGAVFRAIRQVEREVIPQVDRLVYVSKWGQDALLSWLPEAAAVPSAVIGNFVTPLHVEPGHEPLGDLVTTGNLDLVKNHRFLLEVLAEAKRAGRSLTLDVFGEGPCRKDLLRQTHVPGPGRTGPLPRLPARRPRVPATATGPTSMLRTPSHYRWRSSRRWLLVSRSWPVIPEASPSSATTASRPGSGPSTTRLRLRPR